MKRFNLFLTLAVCLVMLASCFSVVAFADEIASEPYTVTVNEENNLAMSKYDWVTDKVGSATTDFTENGIRFENFNLGGCPYAIYQTNKMNEFKYSMYAKLNLTRPSECGYDNFNFDYSNLYISFMIDAGDPVASYTCPWNGNKAIFSICFENLQGYTKTLLYLNESFVGDGARRRVIAEDTANIATWNDGEYHWFEFEFVNGSVEDTYRGESVTWTGKHFRFWFDGQLAIDYFQRDQLVYSESQEGYVDDARFSQRSGYIGFWPSSDFPVGANTADTNCYVEIEKIQVTSYDNGNTAPYEKCAVPDFPINVLSYATASSYETDMDIEIKLEDLFMYEGDKELTYTATSSGNEIGTMRNGYWVWCPTEAGKYYVDIEATDGTKTVVSYLTINVVDAVVPVNPNQPTSSSASEAQSGGCNGGLSASAFGLVFMAAAVMLKRAKRA